MRLFRKMAAYLIVGLLILFAADCSVFQVRRIGGGGLESVAVDQFVAGPVKGNKTEFDYTGTVNQNCSQTLFPQYAASQWNQPCWWLRRHRAHWENVRIQRRRPTAALASLSR